MYSLNKDGIGVYLLTKSNLSHVRQLFCESFRNIICIKLLSNDNIISSLKLELTETFLNVVYIRLFPLMQSHLSEQSYFIIYSILHKHIAYITRYNNRNIYHIRAHVDQDVLFIKCLKYCLFVFQMFKLYRIALDINIRFCAW